MASTRTKADFRALREAIGLSQQDVADALIVRVVTEKRWERPGFPDPPEYAWEHLDRMRRVHEDMVERMVSEATSRTHDEVFISYYRSQESYDAAHDDGAPFAFVNSASREAARAIADATGSKVSFVYPEQ